MADERILEELFAVKQERDIYLNKLLRVKQKISDGCRTQTPKKRKGTPKSVNRSKSRSKSATKSRTNDHAAITNIQITPIAKNQKRKPLKDCTNTRVNLRLKPMI